MNALNTPAADGNHDSSDSPTGNPSGAWSNPAEDSEAAAGGALGESTSAAAGGAAGGAASGAATADSTGPAATTSSASSSAVPTHTYPDRPLYEPLPYGTGFSSPQPLGFGVGPADTGLTTPGSAGGPIAVYETKKSGSPILAVAGLLSMGVAVWAILGAPVITPTVLLAAGLVLMVLVGLVMVVRR